MKEKVKALNDTRILAPADQKNLVLFPRYGLENWTATTNVNLSTTAAEIVRTSHSHVSLRSPLVLDTGGCHPLPVLQTAVATRVSAN